MLDALHDRQVAEPEIEIAGQFHLSAPLRHHHAAIDLDGLAVDVGGVRRGQEGDHTGDLFRRWRSASWGSPGRAASATRRCARPSRPPTISATPRTMSVMVLPGQTALTLTPKRRQFHRHAAGQPDDARLGRAVLRAGRPGGLAGHGGDVDDRAAPCWPIMMRPHAWLVRKTPVRSMSMMRCQSFNGTSARGWPE